MTEAGVFGRLHRSGRPRRRHLARGRLLPPHRPRARHRLPLPRRLRERPRRRPRSRPRPRPRLHHPDPRPLRPPRPPRLRARLPARQARRRPPPDLRRPHPGRRRRLRHHLPRHRPHRSRPPPATPTSPRSSPAAAPPAGPRATSPPPTSPARSAVGNPGRDYRFFSADLSRAVLHPTAPSTPPLPRGLRTDPLPAHQLPLRPPTSFCAGSCYRPLVTGAQASSRTVSGPPAKKAAAAARTCGPVFRGASEGLGPFVLTSGGHPVTAPEVGLTAYPDDAGGLYEWSAGRSTSQRPAGGQPATVGDVGGEGPSARARSPPTAPASPGPSTSSANRSATCGDMPRG